MKNENDKINYMDTYSMIFPPLKIWSMIQLKRSAIDLPEEEMNTNSQTAEAENCTPSFIKIRS